MGQGSYGECYKVDIKGKIIHSGIVRSIAHTRSYPWVAMFPFHNGPCLGKIMQLLHYDKGTFKRIVKKITRCGIIRDKGREPEISLLDMSRISAFCEHGPHLIHAMVQSMSFLHENGVVHCDMHPFNMMLDFTREHHT